MIDKQVMGHLEFLIERYPKLEIIKGAIGEAYQLLESLYMNGGKLLVAGNGGSAADSEHIVGELMKRFKIPRPVNMELRERLIAVDQTLGARLAEHLECSLTAMSLVAHEALSTAYINDADGEGVFAQQLLGYGKKGDLFLAISTSGNSKNILNAAVVAKAIDIKVIGLTGEDGGKLSEYADCMIKVPETETYLVQELHLPIYHTLCMMLETHFFVKNHSADTDTLQKNYKG